MRIIKEKKITDDSVNAGFPSRIISSFFFTGYFPKASGTVASFAALLIFFVNYFYDPVVLTLLVLISFAAGLATSGIMIKRYGDDPSVVVIDEAAGMWLTVLIFILISGEQPGLLYLAVCFFAFRFFDITKLQPAKYFDNLNSPFGVMMDDIVAGIYAGVASFLVYYVITLSKLNPF